MGLFKNGTLDAHIKKSPNTVYNLEITTRMLVVLSLGKSWTLSFRATVIEQ